MIFRGLEPVSIIDFPGHIAAVLFTGGCNLRCPFCHNARLVLEPAGLSCIKAADVLQFLERRAGWVDGLVVTGGEPTLHAGLALFLRQVKERGVAVKLDTNGLRPAVLRELLDNGLVDYVAVDVKAPPHKYPLLAGRPIDLAPLERSIALLQSNPVAYEFRTTIVPELLVEKDVEEIARWIAGASRYILQQFRAGGTLDPALEKTPAYPAERLQAMAERAAAWVDQVTVR